MTPITNVTDYLPQRPPMVMIDTIIEAGLQQSVSALTVNSGNLFVVDGCLSESGLVENIAQTAAAGVGYLCQMEQRPVPVGFIAAIRDLSIHQLPPVGSRIDTTVENLNEVMEVRIVKGTVKLNGESIASCEMRIFVKP